jgi:hypothetical protein
LASLSLPEHTRVQIQNVAESPAVRKNEERRRVRQALLDAGVIRPQPQVDPLQPISEAQLAAASEALAMAGPLSELIIAEREAR